jgi:hypothetical protein
MKAIKIHELDTGKIIIIKSGDNKSWKKLGTMDQSMIKEVVKHQDVIKCGKTIYQPIY